MASCGCILLCCGFERRDYINSMDLQDNQQNGREQPSNHASSDSPQPLLIRPSLDKQEQSSPEGQQEIRQAGSNSDVVDNQPEVPVVATRSQPALREEKTKKRKVRAYVQDFTDYLPEALLMVNKTVIPPLVRTGERYQANVDVSPQLRTLYRPMEEWLVWPGSSSPEQRPSEQQLLRFKQLLGENRTEEELISIRERMKLGSWREVLEYIGRSRGEMRRIFHVAQRNRN